MKNFKKITLGLLGAALLTLGLYSCGNDDSNMSEVNKDLKKENMTNSKLSFNEKIIDDIANTLEEISIMSKEGKIEDKDIDLVFEKVLKEKGYVEETNYQDFEISKEFLKYSDEITTINQESADEYIDYLNRIIKEVIDDRILSNDEKIILQNGITFQIKMVKLAEKMEYDFSNNNLLVNKGKRRNTWRCIGNMAAGHATGLIAGCGSIGGVGAAIGGMFGGFGSGIGAAVGCWAGGSVGAAVGLLTGRLSSDCN